MNDGEKIHDFAILGLDVSVKNKMFSVSCMKRYV